MHGATYTCDVEFISEKLAPKVNWVIDIGLASDLLSEVLQKYNMQNLDEVFPNGEFTTTEFMARQIYLDLVEKLRSCVNNNDDGDARDGGCEAGGEGGRFEGRIRVKLFESHKAWAIYEGEA